MKSLLEGVVRGFAVIATAIVLLTNCGSTKSAGITGDVSMQPAVSNVPQDVALLHLYRPATKVGVLVSYDLHLDDAVVFHAKYKTKTTVRLTSEGLKTLWAMTETKTTLPLDIRLGQEYYVRCDIGMGAFVGRPRLKLFDNAEGKRQFDKIK